MATPIIIPENFSPPFQTANVNSVNWRFVPPQLFFYWLMSEPAPSPFIQMVEFPAYDEITTFTDFTDWSVEVMMQHNGSIPFCKVEGALTYQGSLGTPFVNAGNFYRKELEFSFENLNLLLEGQYFATAVYQITALNPTTLQREVISEKNLLIEFQASAYLFSLISPFEVAHQGREMQWGGIGTEMTWSPMVFNYHIDGPLPVAQDLYYFRCNYLNTPPDVVVSDVAVLHAHTAIHEYFSKVGVSLSSAITSLAEGVYNFTIELSYSGVGGYVGKTVNITLNVLPEVTTGFTVTPEDLIFDVVVGGPIADQKVLSVFTAEDWNVVGSLPTWLQLSQYNGTGPATILVSAINYDSFVAGQYVTAIDILSDGEMVTVPVTMNLSVFVVNPFLAGKLYFTKELDFLKFSSSTPGTYVDVSLEIKVYKMNTYEPVPYTRDYRIPLFQGKGEFHVGTIAHDLFEEIAQLDEFVPSLSINYAKPQYQPAEIKVSFSEATFIEYFGGPIDGLISNELPIFKMVKGFRPFITEGQLSLLTVAQQEVTRITRNSFIATSFTHLGTPHIIVKKNNLIIDEFFVTAFSSSGLQKVIYSYFRFVNDLKPGDNIEILIINGLETRSQRFLVFQNGMESTYFFFENDNGLVEPYEFTGRRRINSNIKHTTTSKVKNLHGYETKAKSENVQSFIVNTGQLSKTDHKIMNAIVRSLNVWCSLDSPDGPYFKVDSTTSKINNQDTSVSEENFDIEFNILENADATVYPR